MFSVDGSRVGHGLIKVAVQRVMHFADNGAKPKNQGMKACVSSQSRKPYPTDVDDDE